MYSWIIVIIYVSIIAALFLVKMSKTSDQVKSQRIMFRSIATFLFLYVTVRIFFLFSDIERNNNCQSILYFQFVFLAYVCSIAAFLTIIRFGENYLVKGDRHIISIIIFISVVLDILLVFALPNLIEFIVVQQYGQSYSPSQLQTAILEVAGYVRVFNYVVQYGSGLALLSFYIYVTVKSTGKIRRTALMTLIGLMIAVLASFLETDAILSSGLIPPYLSPVLFATGISIFAYAYLRAI
ncbi:MAG: hypothetical protein ACOC4M_06280 [Promethearchaeia archaeon]